MLKKSFCVFASLLVSLSLFIASSAFANGVSLLEMRSQIMEDLGDLSQRHTKLRPFTTDVGLPKPNFIKDTFGTFRFSNFQKHSTINLYEGVTCKPRPKKVKELAQKHSSKALFARAEFEYRQEKYCDAANHLTAILHYMSNAPEIIPAWLLLMDGYLQSKDYKGAIDTANLFIHGTKLPLRDSVTKKVIYVNNLPLFGLPEKSNGLFDFLKILEMDTLRELRNYAQYIAIRSAFESITGPEQELKYVEYVLGIHEHQIKHNETFAVTLDAKTFLNRNSKDWASEMPQALTAQPSQLWDKTGFNVIPRSNSKYHQVMAMFAKAAEVYAMYEVNVADQYVEQADVFLNPTGASRITFLAEGRGYKKDRAFKAYLSAARRYFRAQRLILDYKIMGVDHYTSQSFLPNLKKSIDGMLALLDEPQEKINLKQSLELLLDPFQGFVSRSVKMGKETRELINKEFQRAKDQEQDPLLGIKVDLFKWNSPFAVLTTNDLREWNKRRVDVSIVPVEYSELVLNDSLLRRDFGSVESYKDTYHYQKFREYPIELICVGGMERKGHMIPDLVPKLGIDEKTGNTFHYDAVEMFFVDSGDFPEYQCKGGILAKYEMRYTIRRVHKSGAAERFRIAYLWEDKETTFMEVEEVYEYLKEGFSGMSQSLGKMIK